jgi:hypothetical protein
MPAIPAQTSNPPAGQRYVVRQWGACPEGHGRHGCIARGWRCLEALPASYQYLFLLAIITSIIIIIIIIIIHCLLLITTTTTRHHSPHHHLDHHHTP